MIEKKIGQIWIGPKAPPLKWMKSWQIKMPDWKYEIFTDEMLRNRVWYNQELIEEYYRRGIWAGVADLIRYELIYERGGFWPGADCECLHPVDELFFAPDNHAYTVYESEKFRPGFVSPILAANPGNTILKNILDRLHKLKPHELNDHPFMTTGNYFLSTIVPYMNNVTIWPSYTLIPQWYMAGAPYYKGPGKVYANQYWGSTGEYKNSADYEDGK